MQRSRKAHSDDFSCFRKAWGTPYSGLSWSLSIPTPTLELGGISPELVLSPWTITAWSKLQCKDCKKVLGVCYKKCSVFYSSCVEMRNGHYISLDESSHWWTIPKMCLCSCKGTKANGESPNPWQEMTFSTWNYTIIMEAVLVHFQDFSFILGTPFKHLLYSCTKHW